MNSYFELFEEQLLLNLMLLSWLWNSKRLFQGSMNLEDFHTKALRLVKEAEYPEGATWDRILRDTIISGLASDKTHVKIIKEGKDVTLARVMEITRLDISKQKHIDRMQDTAKVNYVQYGKGSKKGKLKSSGSNNSGGSGDSGSTGGPPKSSGKGKKVPLPTDICWRCSKGRHQKGQPCKAVEAVCRNCSIKGHYEKVQYRKGMEIPLADALSHVTPLPMEEDGIKLPIIAVNVVTVNIPYSCNELDSIHEETRKDSTLTIFKHYINMGWPCERKMAPQEVHLYWNFREDLSVEDGLVTKGSRLLIPSTLHRNVLEQIHEGHQDMEKCMLKARESVFWLGISDDIQEAVEKCGICQSSSRAAKPVGIVGEVPPHVWHTLGTDLFYWNKMDYLVVGDYFSKYLLVRKIPNASTHSVIKELGMIYTEFGCPFVVKCDNGLCYSSREFHDFLEFYQIHHITSSPHYPQSNGFAEALVGISKKLMEKSVKDGKLWNHGLLEYRVTPISGNLPSPLEALTGT